MNTNDDVLNDMFKVKPTPTADVPSELICIVDRSGSMTRIRSDAEGGLNAFIAEQKAQPGEANLTIVEFDDTINHVCKRVNLTEATEYSLVPRGMTAMYDAIQYAIGSYDGPDDANVAVVIVTDGDENASRECTQKHVFDLITEKRAAGWDFIFLAANQDAMSAGGSIGISAEASFNFSASGQSVTDAYAVASVYATTTRSGGSADQKRAIFKKHIDDNIDKLDISQ